MGFLHGITARAALLGRSQLYHSSRRNVHLRCAAFQVPWTGKPNEDGEDVFLQAHANGDTHHRGLCGVFDGVSLTLMRVPLTEQHVRLVAGTQRESILECIRRVWPRVWPQRCLS